jgi:hypothetical protein
VITAEDLRRARSFGRSVGIALLLIGVYQLAVRGRATAGGVLAGMGALLAVLGTVAPATLDVPSRLWWRFSHALGWFNSRVLLTLFFFAVLTPLGLVFRLMGRDVLAQRTKGSTWLPYPQRTRDHYEHLF